MPLSFVALSVSLDAAVVVEPQVLELHVSRPAVVALASSIVGASPFVATLVFVIVSGQHGAPIPSPMKIVARAPEVLISLTVNTAERERAGDISRNLNLCIYYCIRDAKT